MPETIYRSYLKEVLKVMKLGRQNPDFMEKKPDSILRMLDKIWSKEDKEVSKYLDQHKVS